MEPAYEVLYPEATFTFVGIQNQGKEDPEYCLRKPCFQEF